MRIHTIVLNVIVLSLLGMNYLQAAEPLKEMTSNGSLVADINSNDIKTIEANRVQEVNRLMDKVTADLHVLNSAVLNSASDKADNKSNNTQTKDNSNEPKKTTAKSASNNNLTPSGFNDVLETYNKTLTDVIELQKKMVLELAVIRDSLNNQPKSKINSNTPLDYVASYAKRRGAHLDPSGFAYYIMDNHGKKNVTLGTLFKLSLIEKTTDGRILSKLNDVRLKYTDKLPPLVYRAVALTGIGGAIRVVAHAHDTYSNSALPVGVTSNTPLIYEFKISPP